MRNPFGITPNWINPRRSYKCLAWILLATTALNCSTPKPCSFPCFRQLLTSFHRYESPWSPGLLHSWHCRCDRIGRYCLDEGCKDRIRFLFLHPLLLLCMSAQQKTFSCLFCKKFFLWKCHTVFYYFVPDSDHIRKVIFCICSYLNVHIPSSFRKMIL